MLKSLALAVLLGGSLTMASPLAAQDTAVNSITSAPVAFLAMHVGGKVRKDALGYSYQWPGVYFEARFASPFVNLMFDDDANNFNVIVDGKPLMILRKPGHRTITIQANGAGPHTVRVEKRSETQYATGHFQGMMAQPADPAAAPARQIEFIGDSYTVGYGNTSAFKDCTPDDIFEATDAQSGFPALVGKHFNADYQVNAFSGLGMVRNWDGHEHPKYRMPMLYPRAIFDDPTPAAEPGWHPQIIVVGIGGNDFSTPLHDDEPWKTREALVADYEATFVKFVKDLRAHNPGAFIVLDAPADSGEYQDAVTAVFNTLKASGETKIDELFLPATDNTGCNGHPNVRDDAKVAAMLSGYIESHPALWQGK